MLEMLLKDKALLVFVLIKICPSYNNDDLTDRYRAREKKHKSVLMS